MATTSYNILQQGERIHMFIIARKHITPRRMLYRARIVLESCSYRNCNRPLSNQFLKLALIVENMVTTTPTTAALSFRPVPVAVFHGRAGVTDRQTDGKIAASLNARTPGIRCRVGLPPTDGLPPNRSYLFLANDRRLSCRALLIIV